MTHIHALSAPPASTLPPRPATVLKSETLAAACRIAGISVADCLSPCRRRDIAHRRWRVMELLHAWGRSKSEIGRLLGRNHASVIHGLRRLEAGRG